MTPSISAATSLPFSAITLNFANTSCVVVIDSEDRAFAMSETPSTNMRPSESLRSALFFSATASFRSCSAFAAATAALPNATSVAASALSAFAAACTALDFSASATNSAFMAFRFSMKLNPAAVTAAIVNAAIEIAAIDALRRALAADLWLACSSLPTSGQPPP